MRRLLPWRVALLVGLDEVDLLAEEGGGFGVAKGVKRHFGRLEHIRQLQDAIKGVGEMNLGSRGVVCGQRRFQLVHVVPAVDRCQRNALVKGPPVRPIHAVPAALLGGLEAAVGGVPEDLQAHQRGRDPSVIAREGTVRDNVSQQERGGLRIVVADFEPHVRQQAPETRGGVAQIQQVFFVIVKAGGGYRVLVDSHQGLHDTIQCLLVKASPNEILNLIVKRNQSRLRVFARHQSAGRWRGWFGGAVCFCGEHGALLPLLLLSCTEGAPAPESKGDPSRLNSSMSRKSGLSLFSGLR